MSRQQTTAVERFKSIPDWAWFVAAAGFALLASLAVETASHVEMMPGPLGRGIVAAVFVLYMLPGWRLATYVQRRWGRVASASALFVWMSPFLLAAFLSERLGY